MPLPEGGKWPPLPYTRIAERLASWSAWYSGDPEALSRAYYAADSRTGGPFDSNNLLIDRPGQLRGGLLGKLSRWFWGSPTPIGEKRHKLHVPIAGDIASTSADLLFGQLPTITVGDTATQDLLDELNDDGGHASLLEAAELTAALGGGYLKICWDLEISPTPWLDVAHADAAIPEWFSNKLIAVTFWEVLTGPETPSRNGQSVIRHLERHERGVVLHGLYEGTVDELGHPIPLTEHRDTQELAGIVNEQSAIPTGTDKLTAAYIPNMRPNRLWRADPAAVNLGRSDYSGQEPLMDALDETWTSWMRDIRLGKARLIVPNTYLQNLGPGKGANFDVEQEVWTGLDMLPAPGGTASMITENQFTIRVAEHSETAQKIVNQIIRESGYSISTFGETDGTHRGAVTATEITDRQRKTLTTRDRKVGYWRAPLRDLYEALLEVAVALGVPVTPERPTIEWADAVSPDPQETAQTIQLLRAAQAMSIETAVRLANPEWDELDVIAEVARIKADAPPAPVVIGQPGQPKPPGDAGPPGQGNGVAPSASIPQGA